MNLILSLLSNFQWNSSDEFLVYASENSCSMYFEFFYHVWPLSWISTDEICIISSVNILNEHNFGYPSIQHLLMEFRFTSIDFFFYYGHLLIEFRYTSIQFFFYYGHLLMEFRFTRKDFFFYYGHLLIEFRFTSIQFFRNINFDRPLCIRNK